MYKHRAAWYDGTTNPPKEIIMNVTVRTARYIHVFGFRIPVSRKTRIVTY